MDVVRVSAYDAAFTFIYSPREGTPAAAMPDQVPKAVIQPRFDRLVAEIQSCALAKNMPLVGTVQRVLFEGTSKRDPGVLTGRTGGNKVVHVRSDADLAGLFADVHIDDAQTWFLLGTLCGEADA
jgi:tRNA-2-methylthio-N6-dimethylallyladenosine synthase